MMLHTWRELWCFTPRHPCALFALGTLAVFGWLHQCVVSSAVVWGTSMAPTLDPGEICLLNKCALWRSAPQRGDLVAFRLAGESGLCVKRVIGLPGEKIFLDDARVYVNQQGLAEPYLEPHVVTRRDRWACGRLTVPPGHYFVLGDNRSVSEDSRTYGCVRQEELRGLVIRLAAAAAPQLPGDGQTAQRALAFLHPAPTADR